MIKNRIKMSISIGVMLILLSGCTRKEEVHLSLEENTADVPDETEVLSVGWQNDEAVSEEPAYAYVHICGAVITPGVYKVEAGSRIYEIIELAGGFLPDACTDYINQAQPVEDGMQIAIPTMQEVEEGSVVPSGGMLSTQNKAAGQQTDGSRETGSVNINTASKEVLCTLPGIGEARAESIIQYREKNGAFQMPSDIMKIDGIKEKAYLKLKDSITVE